MCSLIGMIAEQEDNTAVKRIVDPLGIAEAGTKRGAAGRLLAMKDYQPSAPSKRSGSNRQMPGGRPAPIGGS